MKDFKLYEKKSSVTDQLIKKFNDLKFKLIKSAESMSMSNEVDDFNLEYLCCNKEIPRHLDFALIEYLDLIRKSIRGLKEV